MPRLLRKKLVCFYCGCRSAQDRTPSIRKWRCEKCEAPNYLDERGEITDPPPYESSSATRFASAIPRAAPSEPATPDESPFCSVCVQNQRFMTESLASYFPSTSAPDYPEYEKNYSEFRKNLEDRYPQVCRQCEPRVRNRIRLRGHVARSDHLRRMMARSRGIGIRREGWGWKRLATSAGAMGWGISQAGQVLWNTNGAFAGIQKFGSNKSSYHESACLLNWNHFHDTAVCREFYDSLAGIALGLGLLSIWWYPRLKDKPRGEGGRILGLREFYKLQVIFLTVRFVSWAVLVHSNYGFNTQSTKALHSFMLVFTILSALISFRTVQFDSTPIVLFQDSPGPLIQDAPMSDPQDQPVQHLSQSPVHKGRLDTRAQTFSLNDLAPTSIRPRLTHNNPPTPPPDENDSEAMDWTPSQQSLPRASKYRMPTSTTVQKSPFYGSLPPAPVSQAHKLRNPQSQQTSRQESTPQKQSFFQRPSGYLNDDVSDLASEVGSPMTNRSNYDSPQFNPPRFFPNSDYERNTGLESIFSKTFTLVDEPHEVRIARETQPSNPVQGNRPLPNPKIQILSVVLLLISGLAWYPPLKISRLASHFHLTSLGVAAIVASKGLFQIMSMDKIYRSWTNFFTLFLYIFELCVTMFLSSGAKTPIFRTGKDQLPVMVLGFFGVMVLQELLILILGSWSTNPAPDKNPPPTEDETSVDSKPTDQRLLDISTLVPSPRNERKPSSLTVLDRTTRSKSKLEKNASTRAPRYDLALDGFALDGPAMNSHVLNRLALEGDSFGISKLALSEQDNPRVTKKRP